jgi:hypothetical protein
MNVSEYMSRFGSKQWFNLGNTDGFRVRSSQEGKAQDRQKYMSV